MDQNRFNNPYAAPRSVPRPSAASAFSAPPQQNFNSVDYEGSIQKVLTDNVGRYVVMEFLIGTETLVRKQGILYAVGTGYIVLYDDINDNYIVCDLYAIKFTYFYNPGQRPIRNYNAPGMDASLPQ